MAIISTKNAKGSAINGAAISAEELEDVSTLLIKDRALAKEETKTKDKPPPRGLENCETRSFGESSKRNPRKN